MTNDKFTQKMHKLREVQLERGLNTYYDIPEYLNVRNLRKDALLVGTSAEYHGMFEQVWQGARLVHVSVDHIGHLSKNIRPSELDFVWLGEHVHDVESALDMFRTRLKSGGMAAVHSIPTDAPNPEALKWAAEKSFKNRTLHCGTVIIVVT